VIVKLEHCDPKSEEIISAATAECRLSPRKNEKRIKSIIRAGHMSSLGFASAVISVDGISRACSHQLVRHIFIRYMQQSQRSIAAKPVFIIPPLYYLPCPIERSDLIDEMVLDCEHAYKRYMYYVSKKVKKEDARYILPAASSTGMWMSSSFQGWWDLLYGSRSYIAKEDTKKHKEGDVVMLGASRLDKHAQWEIRDVAHEIEKVLAKVAPNVFKRNFS